MLNKGGTFLGGGASCVGVDCSYYLVPQTLGVELTQIQEPISGVMGDSVAAKNGIFVLSLHEALNSNDQNVIACNVYRGNSTLSQTIYFSENAASKVHVDTDGERVVLASGTRLRTYIDNGSSFTLEQEFSNQRRY